MRVRAEALRGNANIGDRFLSWRDMGLRWADGLFGRGLRWSPAAPCPEGRYDAGGAQVGRWLFVIGGYGSLDEVKAHADVLDLATWRWVDRIRIPDPMAHTHSAIASDGARHFYVVSGQRGAQCRPAVRECFAYDTEARSWSELPAYPMARYAPTMQLWRGRLHVVGGSMEDRRTPCARHFSLAVVDGRALESAWREEAPVPLAATHRGSALLGDTLYVFGGQQGDFAAIPGSPDGRCDPGTPETYFGEVYALGAGETRWRRRADMPIAASHTDFSTLACREKVLLFGGQIHKDPLSFRVTLTDAIQEYDVRADRWTIRGRTPFRVKFPICGAHDGWIGMTTGQRDRSRSNPTAGSIVNDTFRARLG
jgi:hypothetical protein